MVPEQIRYLGTGSDSHGSGTSSELLNKLNECMNEWKMELSILEVNIPSAIQEIPRILWNQKVN
jgi:hypothetical protein